MRNAHISHSNFRDGSIPDLRKLSSDQQSIIDKCFGMGHGLVHRQMFRDELFQREDERGKVLEKSIRNRRPKSPSDLGGWGACIVILSKYDPVLDKVEEYSINSCLTLLCSINDCSITTSEGLGNTEKGFHPIHKRFAGFHASQCGFCTPGMCISLYSALSNAHNSQSSPEYLSASAAEKSIAGNLCRCTSYRPIADACKSFATDVDIEDLGFNSFWRKGESREEMLNKLLPYNPDKDLVTFPDFLKERIKRQHDVLDETRYHWSTPVSVPELQQILATTNPGGDRVSMKIVVGNTGTGYYKEEKQYGRYVDISHIPEMSMIKKDDRGIEIGAVVTISRVIDELHCRLLVKLFTLMIFHPYPIVYMEHSFIAQSHWLE